MDRAGPARFRRRAGRAAALAFACLGFVSETAGTAEMNGATASYWLLVTFAARGTVAEMTVMSNTAYEGVALQIGTAYDKGPGPTADALVERFTPLRDKAHRDIWPWVFLNRVPGLDLAPRSSARQPFLGDWRAALVAARRLGSPGVVLDLEFYSSPDVAWAMSKFAARVGAAPPEAARSLENLGHELGGIVAGEYPNAKILVLTSGLAFPNDERIGGRVYLQPRGHIVLGLLAKLQRQGTPALVIDGGEDGLGYCHTSLSDLEVAIGTRQQKEQSFLRQFRGSLVLAGTIAPWSDAAVKKGWLNEGTCALAQAQRAEDFTPYLRLLDASYHFNWIYAAPIGGYLPFVAGGTGRFDAVLREARGQKQPRGP